MPMLLTNVEARIMGSLIEKSLTTPDQYPLSLNSLTKACNQKSSRDPIMIVDEAIVARGLATLQERGLVGRRSEPGSRVTKFLHHVETLINGGSAKEVGAICVLLLRGPQTSGEIKTRTDRLCEFAGPAEVEQVLQDLAARSDGPFVARLARQTGQKEARYMHLFFPAEAVQTAVAQAEPAPSLADSLQARPTRPTAPSPGVDAEKLRRLEKRVEALEARVQDLQEKLSASIPPGEATEGILH